MTGYVYLPNSNNLIVNKLEGDTVTYSNGVLINELGQQIAGIAAHMAYAIVSDNTQQIGNIFDNNAVLNDLRTQKINEMNLVCENEILNNFTSTAYDGKTSENYDCQLTDQARINGLVTIALLVKSNLSTEQLRYYDPTNSEKICIIWQPDNIIALGLDLKRHVETATDKYEQLKIYINDASRTEDELNNLTWTSLIQ